jgi:two-component system, OmpR family, response regulator
MCNKLRQSGLASLDKDMDPIRVLVVEDEPDLLETVAFFLRIAGFAVTPVASRAEAHAAMAREPLDLVVADSALRGGNGDDVAAAAERRGIRVVLTSGHPDRIDRLEHGRFPFVAKPYSANELIAVMRATLKAPKS